MSCLPALGAESFGALGGWVGIKIFFSDLACGVKALKPCTQTGVCGACARSLAAYVAGSGLLQAPHCLFLVPFSVAGCSFSPSTSSEQRTTSRTTAFFPSQSPLLLKNFFRPPDNLPWRLVFIMIGECACTCSCGACFHSFSFIPCHDEA